MTDETQEDAEFRAYNMRMKALGDGLARTLDAAGAPSPMAVEALSFAAAIILSHLAQRDRQLAAVIANNLANNLLALCAELGITPGDNENEAAGAPN